MLRSCDLVMVLISGNPVIPWSRYSFRYFFSLVLLQTNARYEGIVRALNEHDEFSVIPTVGHLLVAHFCCLKLMPATMSAVAASIRSVGRLVPGRDAAGRAMDSATFVIPQQQRLYFLPLPQEQGLLRPVFIPKL